MKAFIKVNNQILSQMLFEYLEAKIVGVAMYETGPEGFIEFDVDCNPDLISHKENSQIILEFKTEQIITKRTVVVVPKS